MIIRFAISGDGTAKCFEIKILCLRVIILPELNEAMGPIIFLKLIPAFPCVNFGSTIGTRAQAAQT